MEWICDLETNNPDFYQFLLENSKVLYKIVSNQCDLSNNLEVLKLGQYSMNETQFTCLRIDQYAKLTEIEIGIRSFAFVSQVEITNNPNLKSIVIHNSCFCGVKDGSIAIQHNSNLQSIEIGDFVASLFTNIEIDGRIPHIYIEIDLPNLKSILIGEFFCRTASKFILKGF